MGWRNVVISPPRFLLSQGVTSSSAGVASGFGAEEAHWSGGQVRDLTEEHWLVPGPAAGHTGPCLRNGPRAINGK
jgi:hypothetical protein